MFKALEHELQARVHDYKISFEFRSPLIYFPLQTYSPMKTLSNHFMLRPFCLVIAAAFCLAGCSSPDPETSTPQQNDAGVVDMEISSTQGAGSDKKIEEPSATPDSSGDSSTEGGSSTENTESSSDLLLTPPKS